MSNQGNKETSLPLILKIGYGVGDAGSNFCWTFVASFIMIYCTNTLGISAVYQKSKRPGTDGKLPVHIRGIGGPVPQLLYQRPCGTFWRRAKGMDGGIHHLRDHLPGAFAGAGIPVIIGGMTGNFSLVLIGMALRAVTSAPQTGAMNAIIAEADEYSYLKFGHRLTGMIYSCSSVGIKMGTGLGTALCGFILDMGGFDGMAETQTATAVATINWSYLLAVIVPLILAAILFYFLKVEEENKKLKGEK